MRFTALILSVIFYFLCSEKTGYTQESIVLRTDRDMYIAGEPFWLYVNCLLNGSDSASNLSKVVYIEIHNSDRNPVLQKTMYLKNGEAETRFFIPDSIRTGNYMVSAYTNWMKNYNEKLFAHQFISVINPFKAQRFPKSDKEFEKDSVFFYPEGGKLLSDVNNSILIQIIDTYGHSRKTEAYLVANDTDTLQTINTNIRGFSIFDLIPALNTSYQLCYSVDSITYKHTFPKSTTSETVLHVKEKENKITISLLNNSQNNEYSNTYIDIVNSQGTFIQSHTIGSNGNITLKKQDLPKEYLCAYLYNQHNQLLATRYFMANNKPNDGHNEVISMQNNIYQCGEKVDVQLNNIEDLSHVSISVSQKELIKQATWISNPKHLNDYPASTLYQWTDENISVNDILQCFIPVASIKKSQLPNLFIPEIEGKLFSGVIRDKNTGQAITDKTLMMNVVGKKAYIDITKSDSLGRFCFVVNQFGEKEIVIQPLLNDIDNKVDYTIDLDETYLNVQTVDEFPAFAIHQDDIDLVNQAIINMQLNTLYSSPENTTQTLYHEDDSSSFYGSPEYYIPIAKYIELASMEEIIKELIPLTYLQKRKDEYKIDIAEPQGLNPSEGNAFIMVDGVLIYDIDKLLQIPANNIKKVELINLNYFFKGEKLGRILAFYTKDGQLKSFEFDNDIFRKALHFYAPPLKYNPTDYLSQIHANKHLPDYRNLLYWATDINSSEFSFYTSDNKAKYTFLLEGINEQGCMERYETTFEVK